MDAIKIFDEKFKEKNSYYALGCKIVKYIYLFISLTTIVFFTNEEYHFPMGIYLPLLLSVSVSMHLKPYLCIKQGLHNMPIFKIMCDAPIERNAFIRSRISILVNFVIKLTMASLTLNILSNIYLVDTFSLEDTLFYAFYIIFCMLLITCEGIYEIHSKTRY